MDGWIDRRIDNWKDSHRIPIFTGFLFLDFKLDASSPHPCQM